MTTHNAKIVGTMLGFEDHGIFTFMLDVEWDEHSGQGFGGLSLGGTFTNEALTGILKAVGVDTWEKLKGTYIRIQREDSYNGRIKGIGHIIKDQWFTI